MLGDSHQGVPGIGGGLGPRLWRPSFAYKLVLPSMENDIRLYDQYLRNQAR